MPFGLDPAEEKTQVDKIVRRLERMMNRRQEKNEEYLRRLFEKFNREFFDRSLTVNSIIFVNNQNVINGSCTPADRRYPYLRQHIINRHFLCGV